MTFKDVLPLAAAIGMCEAAGAIGTLFTAPSIPAWYAQLAQPSFAPPNWVFAPVWTALFALMGIAAFLVWKKRRENRQVNAALGLFMAQLALNVLWSALFFGLHSPAAALAEIAVLWAAIAATMLSFSRISRAAAWLLAPYFLWVSFASVLNYAFWLLN